MPDKKAMMLAIGIGKPSEVEFDVPEGVNLSDIKNGQEKEVVAVIRKEGERAILVSINGIALEAPEEEEIEEVEETEDVSENVSEKPMSVRDRAASVGLM